MNLDFIQEIGHDTSGPMMIIVCYVPLFPAPSPFVSRKNEKEVPFFWWIWEYTACGILKRSVGK